MTKHLGIILAIVVSFTACTKNIDIKGTDNMEPIDEKFVEIIKLDPSFVLDIRYATENNFTGQQVYPIARCFLRESVAYKLVEVQRELRKKGYGLKIWDCYRPISVQQKFWEIMPDERYVAKPVVENGKFIDGSKHNRGAAVDLTLVDIKGRELKMPTHYDDFSEKAHRDYKGNSKEVTKNMVILEQHMVMHGFEPLPTEWWHFDGPNWKRFPLSDYPIH
ncbi:MAG: M15 family metallopeptidase [Bacteriovoracia bacterium]